MWTVPGGVFRPGRVSISGGPVRTKGERTRHHGRRPTMRTLSLIEFLTLDGVMQSFGSPDEDRDGGFEHGGWGAPYADPVQADGAAKATPQASAYLFGRRTYEKMAAFW